MKLAILCGVVCSVWWADVLAAQVRTWSNRTGAFSVQAKFVSFKEDKVYLERKDGSVISVPMEKLGYADYDYLRALPEFQSYFSSNILPSEHTICLLPKLPQECDAIAFSPDSRFVAGATRAGVLMIDVEKSSFQLTEVANETYSYLKFCEFAPDGKTLVTCSANKRTIILWDVDGRGTLRQKQLFKSPQVGEISSMAFSPDGNYCLTGDERKKVFYWNLTTGKVKFSFEEIFEGYVEACFVNSKGTQGLATDGKWLVLFDLHAGKPIQKMQLVDAGVYRTDISSDGRRVFAEYGGKVSGWSTLNGKPDLPLVPNGKGPVWKLSTSADGRFLLVGRTGSADLWDTQQSKHIHHFMASGGSYVQRMKVSSDGRRVAICSGSNTFQVFRNPAIAD